MLAGWGIGAGDIGLMNTADRSLAMVDYALRRQFVFFNSLAYLKRPGGLYEQWIASYTLSEMLVLDTEKLDYVSDLVHQLDVMERIEAILPAEFRERSGP